MQHEAIIEGLLYPSEDYEEEPPSARPVTLERIIVVFYTLAGGYLLAFVAFLVEIAYGWKKKFSERKLKKKKMHIPFAF